MSVLVRPIRFSNDVSAMATFLEAMGLTASVTSDQGGWATLQARTGGVSLHSAASSDTGGKPGQTSLCFDADDLEGLTGQLQEAGYSGPDGEPLVVNDQAYGRDLAVVVDGQRLTINGVMDDLYGYRSTGAEPGTGDLDVCPIRFVADQTQDRRLLEALGLSVRGEATPEFTLLALPGAGGAVGLHHPYTDDLPIVPGPFAVQLTFETTTPLSQIVDRAKAAGAPATLNASEFGDFVTITDPDGQEIQVHAAG